MGKQCLLCQSSKIQKLVHVSLDTLVGLEKRFSHINIAIVGPLYPSSGFVYLLTIYRTTRWPEANTLFDITVTTCAKALVGVWISSFGILLDMIPSRKQHDFTSMSHDI